MTGAALAVAACRAPAPPPSPEPAPAARLGRRADAIQAGSIDAASTFAVAVVDDQDSVCSGTLIAPNLVLTARHCVADDDGGSTVDCTSDHFLPPKAASTLRVSTDTSGVAFASAAFKAVKVIVPTDTLFCGNDLALLVLDELVPAAIARPATPAIDPKLTDRARYGAELTAIGYGITSPTASDDGTRRKRTGVAILCVPGDATACDPGDHGMTSAELAAGDGLCGGDSGSGAYEPASLAAGKPIVMGVLSRAADSGDQCTDAIYARTDTASALLVSAAKQAASLGGYATPSWADPATPKAPDAGPSDGGVTGGEEPAREDAGAVATEATPSGTVSDGCTIGRARPRAVEPRPALGASVMLAVTMLSRWWRRRTVRS